MKMLFQRRSRPTRSAVDLTKCSNSVEVSDPTLIYIISTRLRLLFDPGSMSDQRFLFAEMAAEEAVWHFGSYPILAEL